MTTSWDWIADFNQHRWTLVVDRWRGVVEQIDGSDGQWAASVESINEPFVRYEGPTATDPMQGRAWCLRKIIELRRKRW
jgi:hypothetical protein